jgi:heme/copper-type cytochrome/quinol oxidase subunit 2
MADTGGWSPDVLQAEVGKPLHLSFLSDDVVHGFAVYLKTNDPNNPDLVVNVISDWGP